MGCNAYNHPPDCDCGFGGDTGGGFFGQQYFALQRTSYFTDTVLGQTAWRTTCPICREEVYYYQNDYGFKVWFQELGWPWTKHPCFEKHHEGPKNATQQTSYFPSEHRTLNLSGLVFWNQWYVGYLRSADGSVVFHGHWVAMKHPAPKSGLTFVIQPNGRCILVGQSDAKPIEVFSPHIQSRLAVLSEFGKRQKIADNKVACFLRVREKIARAKTRDDKIYVCASLYDCTDLDIKELSTVTGLSEDDVWLIADDKLRPKSIHAKGRLNDLVAELAALLQKRKSHRSSLV